MARQSDRGVNTPADLSSLCRLIAVRRVPALALGVLGLLHAPHAAAVTINVSNGAVDDTVNNNCSIVEAFKAANDDAPYDQCPAGGALDQIVLPVNGSFDFTVAYASSTALPPVTSDIELAGNGSRLRRTGPGLFRLLWVTGAGASLTASSIEITGGEVNNLPGGGILVGFGGALTLQRSTVSGNTARGAGTPYQGGGIYSKGTELNLINSTISGNHVLDSTFAGAGVYIGGGNALVANSTISGNTSNSGISAGFYAYDTSLLMVNSIVAGNSATIGDCLTGVGSVSGQSNLTGDGSCPELSSTQSDTINLYPVLADNGGDTPSHALGIGSSALDAGSALMCTNFADDEDQRGTARPQGAQCDIGAIESTSPVAATEDYGDAPGLYTLHADDGPRHTLGGTPIFLGSAIDADFDTQACFCALFDDDTGVDDEDGVTFNNLMTGWPATVDIVASADGKVDLWIDFDANGDFFDAGDQVLNGYAVTAGTNLGIPFNVPGDAVTDTYARIRFSSAGGLGPVGLAPDGEVEDEAISITADVTAPDVTVEEAATQNDPTSGSPVRFTVTFSEPVVTGFDASDLVLTAPSGGVAAVTDQGGGVFTVTVTGMTAAGLVQVSVPAGVAADATGNANNASTSTDNSVAFVADATPSPFSFAPKSGTGFSTLVGASVRLMGFGVPAPISVSAGSEYRIHNGTSWSAWTATAGMVAPDSKVGVRHTSSASPLTPTQTDLDVGGVIGQFVSTTAAIDTDPDAFSFATVTGVGLSAEAVSGNRIPAGYNSPAPISVAGGDYALFNGTTFDPWTNAPGTINPGQRVRVRHTGAATTSTDTHTDLTIGATTGRFTSTTVPDDTDPDPFDFTSQTGVPLSTKIASGNRIPHGINAAAPVSIVGGQYSLHDGTTFGPWTTVPGMIDPGQRVRVRHTSAATPGTDTHTDLTIGTVTGRFTTTTAP